MKPDVSIVVPAFDEQDRLGASIERILQYLSADDAQRTELIVVDDGSTDRTSEIAELAAASFPLITTRVIR
ncbi:MAG TPA: glycosyltransferase, partial [Pyrinomonadaceae bacterium]|nr:glycosyltransferase [Pyrinomonadaceae bacterium]